MSNLTQTQYEVLYQLQDPKACLTTKAFPCSPSTLRRLADKGYITYNHQTKQWRITPKGYTAFHDDLRCWHSLILLSDCYTKVPPHIPTIHKAAILNAWKWAPSAFKCHISEALEDYKASTLERILYHMLCSKYTAFAHSELPFSNSAIAKAVDQSYIRKKYSYYPSRKGLAFLAQSSYLFGKIATKDPNLRYFHSRHDIDNLIYNWITYNNFAAFVEAICRLTEIEED